MTRLHIAMISDAELAGGAAIATSRLAAGLLSEGAVVTRIVAYPDGQQHLWQTTSLFPSRYARLTRRILSTLERRLSIRLPMLERAVTHSHLRAALEFARADVINVHNIHGAELPPDIVAVSAEYAPTVWTLHDMWSFTGRCAYSYDCSRYLRGCDHRCPTWGEYPRLAPRLIADAWRRRRCLLDAHPDLVAVTPSQWLAKRACSGMWAHHNVVVIPNGLPLTIYKPVDRDLARRALDINAIGPVMLAAAQNLTETRKGGHLLYAALQHISHRPFTLVTLGKGSLAVDTPGVTVQSLGHIDHERTKVLAYCAADILVHPAPVDNLPNVVMESIACGTPVVAFPIGGVPDMVRPGQTGWLAQEVSAISLAGALDQALTDIASGSDLRPSCRAVAEADYSVQLQAQRYLTLFSSLVGTRRVV